MTIVYIYLILLLFFGITIAYIVYSAFKKYNENFVLNKVSEKISDGYIIFTANGKITNYNKAILSDFNFEEKYIKDKSIYEIFNKDLLEVEDVEKIVEACKKIKNSNETMKFDIKNKQTHKIFKVEMKSIVNNDIFLRFVMMCKDVTATYEIIDELQRNQDMMANREKFATLGQLISGIVHSLKSPIFAISGELEGLNNLIKEYEESVDDKEVTIEDHYAIAKDMSTILQKVKEQVENISDSITAVRSQVVMLNKEDDENSFTVNELIKYIDVLMKNTLKEYLIALNFTAKVPKTYEIQGNLNALVQAVDNLIMNSIESYHGKTNEIINVVIEKRENHLAISVIDTGCGIPKRIQNNLFKKIITKSDSEKVGIGLFMAYSNIKARF